MAAGPGKPSGGPKGPTTGSGGMAPLGLPYGPQSGPQQRSSQPAPYAPPSIQPVTRRRGSKATTYEELAREEEERRRLQGRPGGSGRPLYDAAERARARTEVQRALHPPVVRLRDAVAATVFRVLTDYQQYFREVQNRALVANSISSAVADTLREISVTASRRTSITRTIETTIDWTSTAVAVDEIPGIKRAILAAIEETVTI